jgi:3-isopropylmalate dehydrogenase
METAVDTMVYRACEIERIAHVGFELARRRRKTLTSVDKQNILETSRLWRRVVNTIAIGYPDVRVNHVLVDNAAMQLVREPKSFDVLLTENLFGDILSDEAAMLTGSIGNLPSASLGEGGSPGSQFGLYEPIGGSAPDIAGKGIANPVAAMLSAALLLRYSLDDDHTALRIEEAVAQTIAGGARTLDIARSGERALDTEAFTQRVLANL